MPKGKEKERREISACKVYQWLEEWDKVAFEPKQRRRKPVPYFYLFKLPAAELKALTGIYRRTTEKGKMRVQDLGIQRGLDEERMAEIRGFIGYGYPWSQLNDTKRSSGKFDDLRKPGWLPTAIVVNILLPEDVRNGKNVEEGDILEIVEEKGEEPLIRLPVGFEGFGWKPKTIPPLEVIDGQHRLWAFMEGDVEGNFELPVVAFHGLDISWQAYLFWTINIKPKKINPSLAFDLYPLLRTEDWLEKFSGHSIYRETRAQELTEALWAYPGSPWYLFINMLGERGLRYKMVTQSAWINSLMATYVKSWEGARGGLGGLFGAPIGEDEEALPWTRAQQAAFLIYAGRKLKEAVKSTKEEWAEKLRITTGGEEPEDKELDLAFSGPHTLLNTDQGIRGFLYVTNDLCYVRAKELDLEGWIMGGGAPATDTEAINEAIKKLEKLKAAGFLTGLGDALARFDWRSSSAPGLSENDRLMKAAFRGAGGYKEIRLQLLKCLTKVRGELGATAKLIIERLDYYE